MLRSGEFRPERFPLKDEGDFGTTARSIEFEPGSNGTSSVERDPELGSGHDETSVAAWVGDYSRAIEIADMTRDDILTDVLSRVDGGQMDAAIALEVLGAFGIGEE